MEKVRLELLKAWVSYDKINNLHDLLNAWYSFFNVLASLAYNLSQLINIRLRECPSAPQKNGVRYYESQRREALPDLRWIKSDMH